MAASISSFFERLPVFLLPFRSVVHVGDFLFRHKFPRHDLKGRAVGELEQHVLRVHIRRRTQIRRRADDTRGLRRLILKFLGELFRFFKRAAGNDVLSLDPAFGQALVAGTDAIPPDLFKLELIDDVEPFAAFHLKQISRHNRVRSAYLSRLSDHRRRIGLTQNTKINPTAAKLSQPHKYQCHQ